MGEARKRWYTSERKKNACEVYTFVRFHLFFLPSFIEMNAIVTGKKKIFIIKMVQVKWF